MDPGQSLLFESLEGKSPLRMKLPAMPAFSIASKGPAHEKHLNLGSSFKLRRDPAKVSPSSALPSAKPSSPPSRTSFLGLEGKRELDEVAKAASKYKDHGSHARGLLHRTRSDKIDELASGITKAERELLLSAPCPVFATAQRIQRSIISRLAAGGMRAPPPIVSRIFQELSNGLLFYNNATKMKEVPVPFPYVQLNAFLLNLFAVLLW